MFVAYLAVWAIAAAIPQPASMPLWLFLAWHGFVASPLVYFAAVLLSSASLNPATWLLTAAGVFASHVTYGVRFIQGVCANKAPCEYIGKDHAHG